MKTYKFTDTDSLSSGAVTIKAEDIHKALKKLKRYVDDMYETKGRELKHFHRSQDVWTLCFCGRDISFRLEVQP